MAQTYIGAAIRRKEDRRFLTGTGQFVDDVKLPHMLHAAVVRSPHAHARILNIDASAARLMQGVVAVLTYQDIETTVEPRPIPLRARSYPGIERFLQYPLAHRKVRYVGEPVAVVIAETRYRAEDALDGVAVAYDPLPAIVDVWQSLSGDVLLFEEHGTNLAYEFASALGDVDEAFRQADYTRKETFRCHRHTANPLETRGLVASYAPGRQELTVWGETKVPHFNRGVLAAMLQMPEHRIHFIEPDVGGGFGVRGEFYPENFLIPFAARQVGRPVKWIEDRREHLISANHSREHVCELEVAARHDGTILGLRTKIYGALGGYARTHGASIPISTAALLTGPYRIPNYQWEVKCLLTNKVGMGTFSAPGRYESCFFRERLLDMMAADLGLDPAELRLKNLIPPSAMPYELGRTRPEDYSIIYDSGDYPALLKKALEMIDYEALKSSGGRSPDGRRHGIGMACFVKSTGTGIPYEGARVVVSGPDQVAVYLGIATLGQGHETVMAQICADGLGVPLDYVAVYHGNTDFMPFGGGTSASRVTTLGGNAVYGAARQVRAKILRLSAGYLDVDPGALEFAQGHVYRKGCQTGEPVLTLGQVLGLAGPASSYNQGEVGLEATYYFQSTHECYPCGAHAVHVAVDPDTGKIDILHYVITEDVGHVINPLLLTGQVVGAAAQGVGATILEELVYNDDGQPLAGTLMDYLLPTSMEVPDFEIAILDLAPSPRNPLGVKGAGEIGIVATGAALSNAVSNALGVQVRELPLSPNKIRELIGRSLEP
jgi:carbon-monoxide dehydrogenase large subunit